MFIFHRLAKQRFCPVQTRFKSAFSPQILPSLDQYAHEIAFFELMILIKDFICYLLVHGTLQFIFLRSRVLQAFKMQSQCQKELCLATSELLKGFQDIKVLCGA